MAFASAIDAQILIWGIKNQATPNRVEMIERARAFFRKCDEDRERIILPAQALAEFLVGYTDQQCRESLALLSKGFIIAPLDAKAAVIAAQIQRDVDLKGLMGEHGIARQTIKADVNVVASAIAAGANYLYSEDGHMKALGLNRIIVKSLPVDRQRGIFDREGVQEK